MWCVVLFDQHFFSGMRGELSEALDKVNRFHYTGRLQRKTALEYEAPSGYLVGCHAGIARYTYGADKLAIETWTRSSVTDLLMYKSGNQMKFVQHLDRTHLH